jgi:large subunit ribosomal protein L9
MNVILLERLANLGDLGEEVNVKAGFARNYLIPQGKAVRASEANRSVFEGRRAELERAADELLGEAQDRAEKLKDGSVGTKDIADLVTEQAIEVAKSEVRLPEGVIRSIGEFDVDLQLHSDVTVSIKLNVVAE